MEFRYGDKVLFKIVHTKDKCSMKIQALRNKNINISRNTGIIIKDTELKLDNIQETKSYCPSKGALKGKVVFEGKGVVSLCAYDRSRLTSFEVISDMWKDSNGIKNNLVITVDLELYCIEFVWYSYYTTKQFKEKFVFDSAGCTVTTDWANPFLGL